VKAEVKAPVRSTADDGNHAARVMADIAARKAQREALTKAAE
jgi:hypothetical protein